MRDFLLIWLPHLIGMGFTFAFGACVGSFVNVVSLRTPQGMSVVAPPSRCGVCGRRLTWYENLPVIGWLAARGRCWSCGTTISVRYIAVEISVALLFTAVFTLEYVAAPHGWWGRGGAGWFQSHGFIETLPAFIAIVALLGALFAATLTDLTSFSIPLSITLVPTLVGLAAWTVQGLMAGSVPSVAWPIPLASSEQLGIALGGGAGILCSLILLARGTIRRSFEDYHEYVKEGEVLADYPHARREMRRELVFLAPVIAGMVFGFFACKAFVDPPPHALQALGGAAFGYIVAAGLMWLVRVVASFAKGVEAMGMGDVHLMGAAGATLGWIDPVIAFFVAPFFGLTWVALTGVWGALHKGSSRREIPYGPHLALAITVVVLLRPAVIDVGRVLFPGIISSNSALHAAPSKVK